ncbi:hypothetical protein JS562_51730 [Agrobacterium sp. S2]|nr:hypothetical protein [Agrobacterium sp. S2]
MISFLRIRFKTGGVWISKYQGAAVGVMEKISAVFGLNRLICFETRRLISEPETQVTSKAGMPAVSHKLNGYSEQC